MTYRSARNLPDLAEGLILGAADHFNERVDVKRQSLPNEPSAIIFVVTMLK